MSKTDSAKAQIRSDGWTPERQLRFIEALVGTRDVSKAASTASMSREGAYRFHNRCPDGLFALLWDRALAPQPSQAEVHTQVLTDGRLMRLLGNDFRRRRGDFALIGRRAVATRRI